jgi:hypothetical protein
MTVNPYAVPETPNEGIYNAEFSDHAVSHEIWRDGKCLVVSKNAVLPNICLFTNEPTDGSTVKHPFAWTHPAYVWIGLLLLILILPFGLLVCAIASPFINHRAKLLLPVCKKRVARWKTRRHVWLGSVALAVALWATCFGLITAGDDDIAAVVFFLSLGVVSLGALLSTLVGWKMKAARIHKNYVWLKGVHPEYLARFPELPMKV